jgi:hypothetical protein
MSPLWPDGAIARAAWDDAADRGLVDRSDRRETLYPPDRRKDWVDRARRTTARRPIRRQLTSYAL